MCVFVAQCHIAHLVDGDPPLHLHISPAQ
jgi:hypothetical protein